MFSAGKRALTRTIPTRLGRWTGPSFGHRPGPTGVLSRWPLGARTLVQGDPAPSTVNNTAINAAEESMSMRDSEQARKGRNRSRNRALAKNRSESPSGNSQGGRDGGDSSDGFDWKGTFFKMFEAAATTSASIIILGIVGYSYNKYYKYMVLEKIENAFRPGDPALVAAARDGPSNDHWIERDEQEMFNNIVAGNEVGYYHLLIGEKGTGKTSMLLDAMAKINGEGCALMTAHGDMEIFRVRLGKALDFEYHEDNIGALFSIRGPRDSSALLDIERAFNKLEKVAIERRRDVGKPLIIIIDEMHYIRDDEDGRDLVELLQQRAESWAASQLGTFIFNSDDFWIYQNLKKYATRMKVHSIPDLAKPKALEALRRYRLCHFPHQATVDSGPDIFEEVYKRVGGRLSYMDRVAQREDMIEACDEIIAAEQQWFLNICGILQAEMDDDVMDQQKYASAAMVLAKALVDQEKTESTDGDDSQLPLSYEADDGHKLPAFTLDQANYIMTRVDFLQDYDRRNIFTIDSASNVRADSVPMMHAFRAVCSRPGFEDALEATLQRISDIESLGRTRELVFKDLVGGGQLRFTKRRNVVDGCPEVITIMDSIPPPEDDDGDDGDEGDDKDKDESD